MDNYITKGSGSLLPIIKTPEVESTFYALRLTPMGSYVIKDIEVFLGSITQGYIISEEVSSKDKLHYHSVFSSELPEHEVRELVRDFLRKYFPEKPKRGDANKQYNLSECIDFEQSVIYLLKDKGTVVYGLNVDSKALEQREKKSYAKYSKAEFAKELEDIKKVFKDKKLKLSEMMVLVVKLKAKYRQPINLTYIHQLCLSCDIHNNPLKAEEVVENFLNYK